MDSANILSILQTLGQGAQPAGPPANVLQAAAAPQPAAVPPPQPQQAPIAPQEVAQAAVAASPPTPKPRRSLLDTIGRISDVFATVGGAHPLYQPTLDARQNHDITVDSATIKNATDKFALVAAHNKALAQVGRGLQAIKDGGGDINKAWPILASRAGLDPDTIQSVGQALVSDPNTLAGLTSLDGDAGDAKSKYSGNVVYAKDATGKIHAFQANQSDGDARDILPAGFTPVDPQQFINTGGAQVGVGKLSGQPQIILPNTEKPGFSGGQPINERPGFSGGEPIKEKPGFSGGRPIAPPPPVPGKADAKASDPQAGLRIISDIQQSFDNLHGLNALPGEGGAVGNIVGAIGRTSLGQAIEAKTGLSSAAQEREILAKNLANLQSDLIKSLPGNATRTRFEQEIQKKRLPDPTTMNYATANRAIAQIREAYTTALNSQPAAASSGNSNSIPTLTPDQALKLPSGARFRTTDGRVLVRH